jgi:arylsulfatase A-like enzyme
MMDKSYRRAVGSVWAFLIVGVFVKLAELTWTFEHRWLLPWDNELVRRTGQISLLLRFSWQECVITAGLFAVLALLQQWQPSPGRGLRRGLGVFRFLLGFTSLASVIGISYYAVYQTHFTVDDLEYLVWAKHLAATAGPWTMLSVQLVFVAWVGLTFGLPWLLVRWPECRWMPRAAISSVLLAVMGMGLWAAGRPNLAEAMLEPNPVAWMLFGRRVSYVDLPSVRTMAPIGESRRAHDVTERPLNVVLVVLESVPAGSLVMFDPSAEGGRTMVQEFGDDLTVFDDIFAGAPNSVASLFAVLTGRVPMPTSPEAIKHLGDLPTVAQVLKARGYHTEFLLNGPEDGVIADLASRGFDRAIDMNDPWPDSARYRATSWGYDDRMLFDEAHRVLKQRTPSSPPFFLTLHTNNPHHPYTSDQIEGLPGSDDPKVRHRLLVRHTMEMFTNFYRELKASGLAESTLVIAYGDHGEAFGEHAGNYIHSRELYWENLHVPVLILHPRRLGLPARIHQLGTLVDVPVTILDIMDLPQGDRDGMSLLFEAPDRLVFSMTDWGPGQIALRNRQYSYILSRTGRELLFDRQADPFERKNLVAERPDVAAAFRARFGGR